MPSIVHEMVSGEAGRICDLSLDRAEVKSMINWELERRRIRKTLKQWTLEERLEEEFNTDLFLFSKHHLSRKRNRRR